MKKNESNSRHKSLKGSVNANGKDTLLNEAQRLHDLGLGIHWLQKNSKKPIDHNWTNGERPSLSDLERKYCKGFNIGTRLGEASKLKDGNFLGALDVDIKSSNPVHKELAYKWVNDNFDGILDATNVSLSGRGNGSCHVLFKTKSPITSKKLYTSPEICEVYMPTAKATPEQVKLLGPEKIDQGIRLRPAWEVDLMSQGRQIVLPGSIHPDTKKEYKWKNRLETIESIRLIESEIHLQSSTTLLNKEETKFDWKPVHISDLEKRIDKHTLKEITDGEDVKDRSSACFSVCMKLIRAGFNDNEILTILTDKNNYLGQTAYEHTNSNSRKKAARWLSRYTLKKAKEACDPANDFPDLSVDGEEWKKKLAISDKGKILGSLANIILIIKSIIGQKTFKRNDFANIDTYGENPPWNDKQKGNLIQDIDITNIINWFAHNWNFEPTELKVNQAVNQIANENKFHPVKEYLDKLTWDKKPRINNFLKKYLNAVGPKTYLQAVSRKFLCAMVARIYEPGIKFDHVMILEGPQGIGKSTSSNILGGDFFTDTGIPNIGDKESYLVLQGKWLIELGELSSMRKADIEKLKAYIVATADDIRPPYGRRIQKFLRQCVFIGTTNSDQYLSDSSGNRRFWPVKVTKCDIEALKRDRDQLFAEAKHIWEKGETLYLSGNEEELAIIEQNKRMYHDPWIQELDDLFARLDAECDYSINPFKFTLNELSKYSPFENIVSDQRCIKRISTILKRLGYRSIPSNSKNWWCKSSEDTN